MENKQLAQAVRKDNDNEVWASIPNYPEYEASTLGRIRSKDIYVNAVYGSVALRKGRVLKPAKNNSGYSIVCLHNNGKRKMFLVHRLVWIAFNGEIEKGLCIDHRNTDKTDNRLDNLKLCTYKENNNNPLTRQHISEAQKKIAKYKPQCQNNNKITSKSVCQINPKTKQIIAVYPSAHEAERQTSINQGDICRCANHEIRHKKNGITWTVQSAGGYIWIWYSELTEQQKKGLDLKIA